RVGVATADKALPPEPVAVARDSGLECVEAGKQRVNGRRRRQVPLGEHAVHQQERRIAVVLVERVAIDRHDLTVGDTKLRVDVPRRDRLRVVAQVDGVAADVTYGDLEVLEVRVAEVENAEPHRAYRSDIDGDRKS